MDCNSKYGEGCAGRHVQAFLGDASRLECFFQCSSSAFFSEGEDCFSRHLFSTGSAVVTATCATTPVSQSTLKNNKTWSKDTAEGSKWKEITKSPEEKLV